jgi:hypothetical protein
VNCPHYQCHWKKECQFPDRCYDHDKHRDELGQRGGEYARIEDDPYYHSSDYRDGPGRDSQG